MHHQKNLRPCLQLNAAIRAGNARAAQRPPLKVQFQPGLAQHNSCMHGMRGTSRIEHLVHVVRASHRIGCVSCAAVQTHGHRVVHSCRLVWPHQADQPQRHRLLSVFLAIRAIEHKRQQRRIRVPLRNRFRHATVECSALIQSAPRVVQSVNHLHPDLLADLQALGIQRSRHLRLDDRAHRNVHVWNRCASRLAGLIGRRRRCRRGCKVKGNESRHGWTGRAQRADGESGKHRNTGDAGNPWYPDESTRSYVHSFPFNRLFSRKSRLVFEAACQYIPTCTSSILFCVRFWPEGLGGSRFALRIALSRRRAVRSH
ncbi:hypothetical protein SBA5_320021 [Candidatus Sulfotelmatomonas gaucii]|uniref:Uncharacterized protein n=1 Tax=Candidatus Sulfuritelmatomonas gaucii TaxID=2043161 RepID=A0A2N9LEG3_9BACT|nr:hypothetical protein SBA5_320021 [Candidatus Sulfotelmatomonas gaucii]